MSSEIDVFDRWIEQGYTLTAHDPRPTKVHPSCKVQVGSRVITRDRWGDVGCVMAIALPEEDPIGAGMNLAFIQYDGHPGNRDVNRQVLTLHEDQDTPPHIPSDFHHYPQPAGPESAQLREDRLAWMMAGGANQVRWDLYHPDRPRIWE